MADKRELMEKKGEIYAQIKEVRESKEWTEEVQARWDSLNAEYDAVDKQIAGIEEADLRSAKFEALKAEHEADMFEARSEVGKARQEREIASGVRKPTEEHRALALQAWLTRSESELSDKHREAASLVQLSKEGFTDRVLKRSARHGHQAYSTSNGTGVVERNMSVGTDADGGYTVPEGFVYELEKNLVAFGGVRQVARILATATGNDMPWPKVDDTSNQAAILAEGGSIGNSVDPTFSNIVLNAYKFSSLAIRVSSELLQDSAFNMSAEIGALLGERIGRGTAAYFVGGTGTSQPQGVDVGASVGVTAASATAIASDELIDLQMSLDPAYQGAASAFVMNNTTLAAIRKLKDGDSQYLWQPGLQQNVPDRLLGKPVVVVQEMDDMATGNRSVLYGDFTKYIIRDAGAMRFFRLDELYRGNDETGFIAFSRHDGRVLQANAIKALVQA